MRISSFREFMIKFTTSRGELNIRYGYSTSANNSGFYIEGSLNNGKYSRSNKMLALIKSLKIDAFDKLIAHMNKNVYGVGEDIMSASFDFFTKSAACNDAINITEAISLFGFDSIDNDDDVDAIIDGKYEQSLPTKKLWRGSDNQRLWINSGTWNEEHNEHPE
jgi:hypothetical protein